MTHSLNGLSCNCATSFPASFCYKKQPKKKFFKISLDDVGTDEDNFERSGFLCWFFS